MVPADAVKAVPGGFELHVLNVISPLSIDEIPDDYMKYLDHLDVQIDGKPIPDAEKAQITIEVDGVKYGQANLKDAIGKTIPVGGKLIIFVPNTWMKAGEEHEIKILVKLDNPIDVSIVRTVV
jgi:hypothetical protein